MSVLKSIEQKIESLVEGVFGRAFKASVQPVELAHKLAKEMSEHKTVSVSRVYVPNEYEIYLSPEDYDKLHSFEQSLKQELANYLIAYARREGWTMVSAPRLEILSDVDLRLGEFGIATRTATETAGEELEPPPAAGLSQTVMYQPPPAAPVAAVAAPGIAGAAPAASALLSVGGRDYELGEVTVIGRSKRCDIVLNDPNASRQHAEVRREGDEFVLVDLDSTNGVKVNRREVKRAALANGDKIDLGASELRFERRS
jgi:hypothetical protein